MDNAKSQTPRAGHIDDMLRSKIKAAEIDLNSSPPSHHQAIDAALVLVANCNPETPDERLDSIAQVFLHFPLPVVAACVDPFHGIATQQIYDSKTHKIRRRWYLPSNGEIRDWCEDHVAELWKLAHINERRASTPAIVPAPRSVEDVARVQRRLDETVNALGGPDKIDVLVDDDPERQLRRGFWVDKARRYDRMGMIMRYCETGMVPRKAAANSDLLISPSLYTAVRGVPLQPDSTEKT